MCSLLNLTDHISRPHLHQNWLRTHSKSSGKARLGSLKLGRVYFLLCTLRTPSSQNPLAYSCCYCTAPSCRGQNSCKSDGTLLLFWWSAQQWSLNHPRPFKGVIRQLILVFCVILKTEPRPHSGSKFCNMWKTQLFLRSWAVLTKRDETDCGCETS